MCNIKHCHYSKSHVTMEHDWTINSLKYAIDRLTVKSNLSFDALPIPVFFYFPPSSSIYLPFPCSPATFHHEKTELLSSYGYEEACDASYMTSLGLRGSWTFFPLLEKIEPCFLWVYKGFNCGCRVLYTDVFILLM